MLSNFIGKFQDYDHINMLYLIHRECTLIDIT